MDVERKKKFREVFGKTGDVSPELTEIFGDAYLNYPDDTGGEKITPELKELSTETGGQFHEISELLKRVEEITPKISCKEHQEILLRHLKDYMGIQDSPISHQEGFATSKHATSCRNQKCQKINTISTWDNILAPERMREFHGEEIMSWEIG
ncbi:hypothetical protein HY502_00875 [Candidatus Woesebacteria bacterium]|nr:hypothetical protein [Candidatus Woesebacteria bacterium]